MLRLRRTTWPRELDAVVRQASGKAGRDGILAAIETRDCLWVAGTRAALFLPDPRDPADHSDSADLPDSADVSGAVDLPGSADWVGLAGRLEHEVRFALRRVGWEQVERAEWNSDESVLHVWESGPPVRRTDLAVDDPGRFGQLLRERISASVLVQRHVPLVGGKGVRVVARRSPAAADSAVTWNVVPDKGLDLEQPGLRERSEAALAQVRDEFGEPPVSG